MAIYILAITSAIDHFIYIAKFRPSLEKFTKIINENIFQTLLKPGVFTRITFSHTPDEARSVGLAKACVFEKYYSVPEKLVTRFISC